MTKENPQSADQAARAKRLAAALRENLRKRKQQARGRRADPAANDAPPADISAVSNDEP
jgi:hypothetical protein